MEKNANYDTLGNVQEKALINMLVVALQAAKPQDMAAHRVIWRPRKKLGHSLSNINPHALAVSMADTLPEAKA